MGVVSQRETMTSRDRQQITCLASGIDANRINIILIEHLNVMACFADVLQSTKKECYRSLKDAKLTIV